MWDGDDLDEGSEGVDAVDVQCGVFGIPGLMAADGRVFAALVFAASSSSVTLSLMMTEPMRAAVDFKWQAYGLKFWRGQVMTWLTLFVSWIVGLYLAAGAANVLACRLGARLAACSGVRALHPARYPHRT